MSEPAVLLCGHGSRDNAAVAEFERLAAVVAARLPARRVSHGFLEFARPTIGSTLETLRESGASAIDAVPGMLFAAGHAKNDIPSVLNGFAAANLGLAIRYGRDLAVDPLLLRAAAERIEAAQEPGDAAPAESLLVVVGRGTSDPDANSNIAKVTRMLWEGLGFGWAETCYSGVTTPLVGPALERIAGFGFKRIVVFPYFLFTGVLVRRIYDAVDAAARAHPGIAFRKAAYLNDHPLVVDAFLARIAEIPEGDNRMNCQLCKYREQIIGHEGDLGAPQVGHHHHVEGSAPMRTAPAATATITTTHMTAEQTDMAATTTADYLRDPEGITRRSFAIIRRETDVSTLPAGLVDVAYRMVHASGMTDLVEDLAWSADVAETARAALAAGAPILADCQMVASGISRSRFAAGNAVICTLAAPGLAERAASARTTRSAAAVDLWRPQLAGAVCVIGNAPTALFRLLELLADGAPRPAAIVATPPGFVGASEAKAALASGGHGVPFLTLLGRRGGSAVAAAAVNALAAPPDSEGTP